MEKPIEIDNVIDKEYQEKLLNLVTDIKFPWHYMEDTTFETKDPRIKSTPAFGHLLYGNNTKSEYLDEFTPLMLTAVEKCKLKLISPLRLRLGFLLNTIYPLPSIGYKHNTPHVDCPGDHYTMCYYLNSSDGKTEIFEETQESPTYTARYGIEPRQGKIVCFNGRHYHASTCPKLFMKRIVLTINFTAEPI
jgi:2OG-Fe(II) oxygenase superfamily